MVLILLYITMVLLQVDKSMKLRLLSCTYEDLKVHVRMLALSSCVTVLSIGVATQGMSWVATQGTSWVMWHTSWVATWRTSRVAARE